MPQKTLDLTLFRLAHKFTAVKIITTTSLSGTSVPHSTLCPLTAKLVPGRIRFSAGLWRAVMSDWTTPLSLC
jgi:hypothetical protein